MLASPRSFAAPRIRSLAPVLLWAAFALSAGSAVAQPPIPEGLREALEGPKPDEGPPAPAAVWSADVSDRVTALAFSPDGSSLAVGTFEAVELLCVDDAEPIRTLKTREGFVEALAWAEEDVLTVGDYRRLTRWNPQTGRGLEKKTGPRGYVTGFALLGEGEATAIVAASEDGTVRRWEPGEKQAGTVEQPLGPEARVPIRALAAHGARLAVTFGDPDRDIKPGPVFLLNATTLEIEFPLPEHLRAAECVTFSAGGEYLLSGGADEVGRLSHLPSLADKRFVTGKAELKPKPIGRYAGHARPLNAALALPSDDYAPVFATGSGGRAKGGNELRVWRFEPNAKPVEAKDGELPGETVDKTDGKVRDLAVIPDFAGPVRSLALSADGALLAAGDDAGAVRLYQVANLMGEKSEEPKDDAPDDDPPGGNDAGEGDEQPNPEAVRFSPLARGEGLGVRAAGPMLRAPHALLHNPLTPDPSPVGRGEISCFDPPLPPHRQTVP
ncbi:MAG: hypothetical protein AAF907_01810 [Planctomycetota bacterium]